MCAELQRPLGSGFDATSTVDEVLESVDLGGRTALVTGGYSGIGLEMTRALSAAGATVLVPARRPDLAKEQIGDLPRVEVGQVDLGEPESIAAYADSLLVSGRDLDLQINNAGIMAPPLQRVGPGWESQLAVNHLGHFALTNRLWPALRGGDGARVVAVSSAGHKLGGIHWQDPNWDEDEYDKWLAYGQSKTADALFAVELDRLARGDGVRAFSAHPGGIATGLQRHLTLEDEIAMGFKDANGNDVVKMKTPPQGAATPVWAATSAQLDGRGGVYCEDCDIARVEQPGERASGVATHAFDPEEARRLWTLSAEMTGLNTFA